MRWLDSITDSTDMDLRNSGRQDRTGKPGVLQSMGLQELDMTWQLNEALNTFEASSFSKGLLLCLPNKTSLSQLCDLAMF